VRHFYREWDGTDFPTQEHLSQFDHFLDYLMEYGQQAMDALRQLELDPEAAELLEKWIEEGLLEKAGARFRLTPRAINSLQRKALMEIFRDLQPGATEGHETRHSGTGGERAEGTRPYQFGDPVSELDLSATLRNSLRHSGPRLPLGIREEDFEVHLTESAATCSTVILLDMSGSMARWSRFTQAKRCAMAVHALIRQRFANDTVDVVGFYSAARQIPEHKLPLVLPKRVTLFDPEVRLRVPLDQADDAPQHFTNLHMGLMLARRILARRGGMNKQVFIITDGQPTAHVQGEYLYLLYPPDEATTLATLTEAMHLTRSGVRFSTFALIEDYYWMEWVGFVDQLTRLTKGVAFYCTAGDLSGAIVESYLSGRKRKAYIA
jgi:uncharacterized protein with von Willebrand factor type A (vWA) domain